LNEITGGGVSRKTLNILLAGTGVGKTLVMCDMAAHHLENGYNVLYITNEMAEERIAERIDASLLDFAMDELQTIPSSTFMSRINALKKKTQGRLKIKEYPTSSASVLQFEHLLNELKIKNNFIPDIIYVDYLNICASARVKMGGSVNSYLYVKSIAEELRGFAVKHNVPIISATQTNREGFDNSDVGMTETSESFGVPMTLDLMLALISNEELDKMQQLLIKQLKNRYEDWRKKPRFVVGLERAKMKMYDLDDSAQSGLLNEHDDTPVMDRTNVGSRINDERPGNKHRRPGSNRNIETFANREL
jgi:replicative DNA helicase